MTAYTEVGNRGWQIYRLFLPDINTNDSSSFKLTVSGTGGLTDINIENIVTDSQGAWLDFTPFPYESDFNLTCSDSKCPAFTKSDVTDVKVKNLDKFAEKEESGVLYRLYSPSASVPHPLILFLHGGGECGYDNFKHMVGTLGAIRIAESYPDMYVMAPQAPGIVSEMLPDPTIVYRTHFSEMHMADNLGWHRNYLASICDIIQNMINRGLVDRKRIYLIGMSMGGAGVIRMLSVGNGLFAAAAPICPTMVPETYKILCSLTNTPLWISTAYADHTLYRHKYIVDAVLHLRDSGNQNVHLTLYSPEEMERYGFAAAPDISIQDKLAENHNSWVLTLNNEYGIMDWLVSQHN